MSWNFWKPKEESMPPRSWWSSMAYPERLELAEMISPGFERKLEIKGNSVVQDCREKAYRASKEALQKIWDSVATLKAEIISETTKNIVNWVMENYVRGETGQGGQDGNIEQRVLALEEAVKILLRGKGGQSGQNRNQGQISKPSLKP